MAISKTRDRKLRENRVSLRFDLVRLLQRTETSRERRRALMPFLANDNIKREFGFRAAEEILQRLGRGTGINFNSGTDRNLSSIAPYRPTYKQSDDFKIFGKGSTVNLQLSGAMHASLRVLGTDPKGVTIGMDGQQATKAFAHIKAKGPAYKIQKQHRDFLGLPDENQIKILNSIIKDQNQTQLISDVISIVQPTAATTTIEAGAGNAAIISSDLIFAEDLDATGS